MLAPRAVDLFCGCGGFSEGARLAGLDVTCGVDVDPDAIRAYALNFARAAVLGDVRDPSVRARVAAAHPRVLLGSPPLTESGGPGQGDPADLTVLFARIVCECRPDAFLLENAPRVLGSRAYETAERVLNEGGYSTVAVVLSATDHGVAQRRRRAFVIGARDPGCVHRVAAALRATRPMSPVSVRDVVPRAGDHVFILPRNNYQAGVVSTDQPYPAMRSNRGRCLLPPPPGYMARCDDSAPVAHAHVLSAEDAARVNSFGPHFAWPASRTLVGRLLENCVPPRLAQFICGVLREALDPESDPDADPDPAPTAGHRMPVNLRVGRQRASPVTPHSYMSRFCELDPRDAGDWPVLAEACAAVPGSWVEQDASGRGVVRYCTGRTRGGDEATRRVLGWDAPPGWTLLLRERITRLSRCDDYSIAVPGYRVPFRSRPALVAQGLLPV
jgi:DNA (cytosine-5)-methyltransferase 1